MTDSELRDRLAKLIAAEVPPGVLSPEETDYLERHLQRLGSLEEIWSLMDLAWEAESAGFDEADQAALGRFYAAPVWLLNGIFTEMDPQSREHREAIAAFARSEQPACVVDCGGGFGALARRIAAELPQADVVIVEPWPHALAQRLVECHPNLRYALGMPETADLVIAQDVLEHVVDPLAVFARLLDVVKPGGAVVAANCFQPVIRCHYPGAFHVHFTFRIVAEQIGCRFEGAIPGAAHAHVFRKTGVQPAWTSARGLERLSRASYPLLKLAQRLKRTVAGAGSKFRS